MPTYFSYSSVSCQGGNTSSLKVLAWILVNVSRLLNALAIRVVNSFGIRLHGVCEVTPYMEAATACHGISLICHKYTMVRCF